MKNEIVCEAVPWFQKLFLLHRRQPDILPVLHLPENRTSTDKRHLLQRKIWGKKCLPDPDRFFSWYYLQLKSLIKCNCSVPSQLRVKMHSKSPSVMAFCLVCLGILAKNMPKHLAGYYLLNSYFYLYKDMFSRFLSPKL